MNEERTELTRDELLVVLIEEAGEVIQAATKCLRFGYNREWPGYGRNDLVLAREMGELCAIGDKLALDYFAGRKGYDEKIKRVEQYKAYVLKHPV
jgi:hypothetical protein